jgi:hypothetical protein
MLAWLVVLRHLYGHEGFILKSTQKVWTVFVGSKVHPLNVPVARLGLQLKTYWLPEESYLYGALPLVVVRKMVWGAGFGLPVKVSTNESSGGPGWLLKLAIWVGVRPVHWKTKGNVVRLFLKHAPAGAGLR